MLSRDWLWTLPQPLYVFACTLLVASAYATDWMDGGFLTGAILLLTIPLCWVAERLVPKRRDWLLSANDFYDSAISDFFTGLREAVGLTLTF